MTLKMKKVVHILGSHTTFGVIIKKVDGAIKMSCLSRLSVCLGLDMLCQFITYEQLVIYKCSLALAFYTVFQRLRFSLLS